MQCNKTLALTLIPTLSLYDIIKYSHYKMCIVCAQNLLYVFSFFKTMCRKISNTKCSFSGYQCQAGTIDRYISVRTCEKLNNKILMLLHHFFLPELLVLIKGVFDIISERM